MLPLLLRLFGSIRLCRSDSLKANREQTPVARFLSLSHLHPLCQSPVLGLNRHSDSVFQPLSLNTQNREALRSAFQSHHYPGQSSSEDTSAPHGSQHGAAEKNLLPRQVCTPKSIGINLRNHNFTFAPAHIFQNLKPEPQK